MSPENFVNMLASIKLQNTFNPYSDTCENSDGPRSVAIRKRNLRSVLELAITKGVDSIWIARDLGYRGGRRTGLALTDEAHLDAHAACYNNIRLEKATIGPIIQERTATVIWDTISSLNSRVFLWNAFPLHPHEPGNSLSNRCHTKQERAEVHHILVALLEMIQPRVVVSIGRDAQLALEDMGISSHKVRHPSYGGQTEFISGINALYGVQERPRKRPIKSLSLFAEAI